MNTREQHKLPKHLKNRLGSKVGTLFFGILLMAVAFVLFIGSIVADTISDDFSRRLARQYSIEAAANFITSTNSHFVLSQQLAHSTTISRWMYQEDDEEIRNSAIEEIMGYVAYAPHIFLMFTSNETANVYDLRIGFTEEDFVPWWQVDRDNDLWYTNTRDAELPFNINIQRSRPVDGTWSVYIWTNHRMYYNGKFVGVITAGSSFESVFDTIFGDFEFDSRRGYIIDYDGLVRADSAQLLKVLDEGLSHPAEMPEALENPNLAQTIDAHLQTMVDGAFRDGEIHETIAIDGDFHYAAIAPIIGTNWSVVVLSGHDGVFDMQFFPMFILMVLILPISMLLLSFFMRRIAVVPLYNLTKSIEQVGAGESEIIYGLERNDEIGDLAHTIEGAIKAEESNKAKSRFLARMSHELRTPISTVLGISELQLRRPKLPPQMSEAFSQIHNSSMMLLRTVNSVLDFSKIESGKMTVEESIYETESLAYDAAVFHMVYMEHKGIDFRLEIDENLPTSFMGDVLRIKQIINNLISNAFKYTEKGSIVLSFGYEHKLENSLTLTITIKDTGMGMSEAQLNTIKYSEYLRFHEDKERFVSGTGLGISIVHSLAEMMDGKVTFESEVDKGTTVVVAIPQKIIGTEVLGSNAAARFQDFKAYDWQVEEKFKFTPEPMPYGRVLVVDDVHTNLYVAEGLLAFYDLMVETCSDGLDAVEKIEQGEVYDIVFMDYLMPVMNGVEAMQKMRAAGYQEPIVALTANALVGQAEEFYKHGFDGFLSKPIETMQLNEILLKFIRDKQPPEVIAKAKSAKKDSTEIDGFLKDSNTENVLSDDFYRSHKKTFQNITEALEKGDTELAHRLSHNVKGTAGLIGEDALVKAAETVEHSLRDKTMPTKAELSDLERELSIVIERLALSVVNKSDAASTQKDEQKLSNSDVLKLIEKLEPLLKENNAECLNHMGELRNISQASIIVRQIESFNFDLALKSLETLKELFEE
ncbi:MAG: response regulator [Oscillospiraceae bacterium]|nr:response regulator [Oscillospiraceae bacterium]